LKGQRSPWGAGTLGTALAAGPKLGLQQEPLHSTLPPEATGPGLASWVLLKGCGDGMLLDRCSLPAGVQAGGGMQSTSESET
jgi:hypothetical protein